jgi:hypothetical protein
VLDGTPGGGPACLGNLRNNPAYPAGAALKAEGADSAANSRDLHLDLTPSGFDSAAATGRDAPRRPDGSLPDVPMFRPSAAGAIIGRGAGAACRSAARRRTRGTFEG